MKAPIIRTENMSFDTIFALCDLLATHRDEETKKWKEAIVPEQKATHSRQMNACADQVAKLCKYLDS